MRYTRALLIGLVTLAVCGGCAPTSPTATVPQCRDGVYNRATGMCLSPGSQ